MPEQDSQRRRIVFTGTVQGVGFRVTARRIARGFPVTGWVRNEPDGSVTVEVQGTAPGVEGFLAELRETMGPLMTGETGGKIATQTGEQTFEIHR